MASKHEPDFPIEQYTLEELEAISYHVQGARWHIQKAIDALDETDLSIGCQQIVKAYAPLTYVEKSIQACVRLKQERKVSGDTDTVK